MSRRLYLVALRDRSGGMLAGCHFLAESAAEAKRLGEADFRRTLPEGADYPKDAVITATVSASKHPERFAVNL